MKRHRHARRYFSRMLTYSITAVVVLGVLLPVTWLFIDSFKCRVDRFAIPPKLFFSPTLDNYRKAFVEGKFIRNMLNSLIIALSSTALGLMVGIPSAYLQSRRRSRLEQVVLFLVLSTRVVPELAIAVPLYRYFQILGLMGTHLSIILSHTLYNIAFVLLLMKDFFSQIPKDLEEAALVDGCTGCGAFFHVTAPLAAPGIAATAIFCLIMSWDEFVYSFILSSEASKTLPVAVPTLITLFGAKWGQVTAVSVVTMVPVIRLAMTIQRALVRGLTLGAVKG